MMEDAIRRGAAKAPGSWLALGSMIVVASATVSVIAAAGPPWPGVFAQCSGSGIHVRGQQRIESIAAWQGWFRPAYAAGLVTTLALAAGGVRDRRPSLTPRVAAIGCGALLAVGLAARLAPEVLLCVALVPAVGWSLLLAFPRHAAALASALCLLTLAVSALAAQRLSVRQQGSVQVILAALLCSAWAGLAVAGFPSPDPAIC